MAEPDTGALQAAIEAGLEAVSQMLAAVPVGDEDASLADHIAAAVRAAAPHIAAPIEAERDEARAALIGEAVRLGYMPRDDRADKAVARALWAVENPEAAAHREPVLGEVGNRYFVWASTARRALTALGYADAADLRARLATAERDALLRAAFAVSAMIAEPPLSEWGKGYRDAVHAIHRDLQRRAAAVGTEETT